MIVTASIAVTAVGQPDPVEYADIECQPGSVPVDCNNIQTVPLVVKAVYRSGAGSSPLDVFLRMRVMAGDAELGTADSPGAMSEWSYLLPADQWGNSTSITVEAYQDGNREQLLVSKSVGISRQNPTPFPVEGDWKPLPFKYKNGEYFLDRSHGFIFMWMNPIPGNSEIHPFEDVKQNPLTTSWKQYQEYPLLGTKLLLAERINADQINADGIKAKNVDITGKITATAGTIGGFKITSYNMTNGSDSDSETFSLSRFGCIFQKYEYTASNPREHLMIHAALGGNISPAGSIISPHTALFIQTDLRKQQALFSDAGVVTIRTIGGREDATVSSRNPRQCALRIKTEGKANDVAIDFIGKINCHGREAFGSPYNDYCYTGGVGFQHGWDPSQNRFRSCDLFFVNGLLSGILYHE